jgi:hypothetical protein
LSNDLLSRSKSESKGFSDSQGLVSNDLGGKEK